MGRLDVQVYNEPGYIKLKVPALRRRRLLTHQLKNQLSQLEGIDNVTVLPSAGIFKIRFQKTLIDESVVISIFNNISYGNHKSVRKAAGSHERFNPLYMDRHPKTGLALSLFSLWASVYGKLPVSIIVILVNMASLPVYRRAIEAMIKERKLTVDFLDALAHTIAQIQGDFSAVAFMAAVLNIGDFIRLRTAEQAERVITDVLSFEKHDAWVVRDDKEIQVPVSEIEVGEKVIIYPGNIIPIDGMVVHGSSSVDQKSLTGESLPVTKSEETKVYAGTIVLDGIIEVIADKVREETSVARIVKIVSEGALAGSAIEDYARRFGDKLVLPTIGISAGVSAMTGDWRRFTSMVIVDYGTGIRLAAPTAVLSQMVVAARSGVLIKGGRCLENIHKADIVVFDKTGTLTLGKPSIHDVIPVNGFLDSREIIGLAATAESKFTHPVALAVREKAEEENIEVLDSRDAEFHIGYGVEAYIDGKTILLGSEKFMAKKQIDTSAADQRISLINESGRSVLLLAVDGSLAGVLSYSDTLRPETPDVLNALRKNGVRKVIMLTGDKHTVAASIAAQAGIDDFVAEALPDQKLQYVKRLQQEGHTVIAVGDGINDSPALTAADVGITVRGGVELAREAADVVLLEESLWKIVDAFKFSSTAMDLIEQDRKMLLAVNSGVFIVAGFGVLSPVVTSAISDGASILATLNSMRYMLPELKWVKALRHDAVTIKPTGPTIMKELPEKPVP